jgi:hypothetical protein
MLLLLYYQVSVYLPHTRIPEYPNNTAHWQQAQVTQQDEFLLRLECVKSIRI